MGPTEQNRAQSSLGQYSLRSGLAAKNGAVRMHPDRRRSWMTPEARRRDLDYFSDERPANDVDVYAYVRGKGKILVGTLTGFDNPRGECVDKAGDVWIVNLGSGRDGSIVEYAHGGTSPIAKLSEPYYYPYGCSVDATTGDLAVTNFANSYGSTQGNVAIYKKAKGTPTYHIDPNIYHYVFCGYDNKGNLFVDGFSAGSAFEFAELPASSNSLTDITLNQTIKFPGGVQWDGRYVAVGDSDGAVIYQFTIKGSNGTKVGSTPLTGSDSVTQFWIQGGKVMGPNNEGPYVFFWNYPAGGAATKTLNGFEHPIGSVVSKGE